jgi:hypothetical protein
VGCQGDGASKGQRKIHYHLLLPQPGCLLLKNSGEFLQKRYAFFSGDFPGTLYRFFRGRDSIKGTGKIARFFTRQAVHHLKPQINSKTFEGYLEVLAMGKGKAFQYSIVACGR